MSKFDMLRSKFERRQEISAVRTSRGTGDRGVDHCGQVPSGQEKGPAPSGAGPFFRSIGEGADQAPPSLSSTVMGVKSSPVVLSPSAVRAALAASAYWVV